MPISNAETLPTAAATSNNRQPVNEQSWRSLFTPLLIAGLLLSQALSAAETEQFVIGHSWDGIELAEQDKAVVAVNWLNNGDLSISIDAPFANDPAPNCANTACWELWNFEVVELFLVGAGDPAPYTEIEISPWGHHLVLQLLGSRNTLAKELPLQVSVVRSEHLETPRWSANAILSGHLLPSGDLRVNAYRVSGVEPNRHYHVMTPMVGDVPDFHHIDQFTQILKRPD